MGHSALICLVGDGQFIPARYAVRFRAWGVGLGTRVGAFAWALPGGGMYEAVCVLEVMRAQLLNSRWIYLPHFSLLSWSLPGAFRNLATRKDSIFPHACITYAIKFLSR